MSNLSLVSPGYNLTSTLLEIKLSIPITQDIPTIVVYPFHKQNDRKLERLKAYPSRLNTDSFSTILT